MCGISMIFHGDGKPVSRSAIMRMNSTLNHRGPDEQSFFIEGSCGLGHTRLSIVDIANGHQPMTSGNGRFVISYNGEIYNYNALGRHLRNQGIALKTKSDTEALLELCALEGKDALSRLRGMFAFVVYDKSAGSLFAARDRLGIKPFYYYYDGTTFVAASEIKAIFASGLVIPELNLSSIRNHFKYQFSISPHTSFKNIYELPPGHFLLLSPDNKLTISKYWDLEFPEDGEYETDDFAFWKSEFESALHDAADTHTIGEVPLGAYLSGGLDSSTTSLLLKEHYPKDVETYSIHFSNPNSDESYAYKPVAEHLGLRNTELTMDDDREGGFFGLLYDCIYHLEQPQRLPVDIPHFLLSDMVKNQQCKVVYTGDGADEILAGYDSYRHDSIRLWGNALEQESDRENYYLSDFSANFSSNFLKMLVTLHKPEAQAQVSNYFGFYPVWFDFWSILDSAQHDLFVGDTKEDNQQMDQLVSAIRPYTAGRHRINQSLYLETKTRLPNWILWKSDRLSMAHSVEARVPFMDHPLVELAARIPPDFKLQNMDEKYVLKQIVSPQLPHIPGDYKKRGFYTPIREWFFRDHHRDALMPFFSKQSLEETGIFNPITTNNLLEDLIKRSAPKDMNEYYRTMQLEWTLMLVLTTQILHNLFIAKEAPCFHDIK